MIHPLPPEFTNRPIKIVVAGAGGTGSQVLSGLARMHIALTALGHPGFYVGMCDPDIVTEANIGRQLFSPSDLGANKAAVLINRVNCFFNLDWGAYAGRYTAGARWSDEKADILIGCVDSAAARRNLAQTRFRYWLDCGNSDKTGQVILGTRTGRTRAPRVSDRASRSDAARANVRPRLVTEIFPELKDKRRKEDNTPSCSLAEALERQDLFINQSVATFALQLLWQFIRQGGLDIHGYIINLQTGHVMPMPIK